MGAVAERVKLERDDAVEERQDEGQYSALFIDGQQRQLDEGALPRARHRAARGVSAALGSRDCLLCRWGVRLHCHAV